MMDRHPMDGDAIAADCPEDPDMDGARWLQHPTMFMFCTDCADESEGER